MAPTSGKKPVAAKKVTAKKAGGKKAKKGVESYKLYIFKVLKQVHPDTGISSKAMAILNSFIADQFEKIATAAAQVSGGGTRRGWGGPPECLRKRYAECLAARGSPGWGSRLRGNNASRPPGHPAHCLPSSPPCSCRA
jgi:hypothetical protein